jgi:hypothetical protein
MKAYSKKTDRKPRKQDITQQSRGSGWNNKVNSENDLTKMI